MVLNSTKWYDLKTNEGLFSITKTQNRHLEGDPALR